MRSDDSAPRAHVLIATDDTAYAIALSRHMELEHYAIERCHDAKGVLRLVGRKDFDIIVLDLELSGDGGPGDSGNVDLVSYARRRSACSELILLFDPVHIDRAMEGIRRGAYFYLPKGCPPADVALVVDKALRDLATRTRVEHLEQDAFEEMMGGTPAMNRVVDMVRRVAPTDSTVLLLGESGTGKEVLANTLHRLSPRRDMPFIAINCAALPEQLLESEMFGHVQGAFTGAHADKRGLFEEADGGTILLDEIGDMALITQAKLLRVLQNGEIRPVGASQSRRVNVRVLAATNRDLERAVAEGRFREDLYFRLNVIQIRIPPLRERLDVLPSLVAHFIARGNRSYGKQVRGVDKHAEVLLRTYSYPGNIRELESIIAHAVIMCDGDVIGAADLPDQVRQGYVPRLALPDYVAESVTTLSEMEAQLIRMALDRLNGNQTEAAKKLGISRSTLWRKMKEYNIER